jgi:hypothetical protein
MLTRRQRNEIFELLVANGVQAGSCDLLDPSHHLVLNPGTPQVTIQPKDSSSYFTFWSGNDIDYGFQSTVGGAGRRESDQCTWKALMDSLVPWAREVAYEADTPDLWAEAKHVPDVLTTAQSADASNAPFTRDEQAEISNRLDEVKQLVREKSELTDEQLAAIDQRLDDAEQASKRLGRKDWLMAFYGAVLSTGMTDAVPIGVIQSVLSTVVHGLAHIFGVGGLPPMINP